ncbi:MAG TPA: hypothetical protein VNQ56_10235 [Pseudolabrys sp.]|nr:hypothetical protein [Pseudolabrys sp.]
MIRREIIERGIAAAVFFAASVVAASAQTYGPFPPNPVTNPPPAASPLLSPGVPQMPVTPMPASPGPSFSDRVTQCLQDGASIGYGSTDLSGYTRACANNR